MADVGHVFYSIDDLTQRLAHVLPTFNFEAHCKDIVTSLAKKCSLFSKGFPEAST